MDDARPGTVWYLSKYVAEARGAEPGTRGYHLMAELARRGVDVTIVCSDAGHRLFGLGAGGEGAQSGSTRTDGIRMIRLRTFKYRKQRSVRRILGWVQFELMLLIFPKGRLPRPDVVIVSSLSLLTVLNGLVIKLRYRCRLVFEVRDIWPLTLIEEGGYRNWNPLVRALGLVEWAGYRLSDAIVGTMPNLGEHVQRVLGFPRQVHCVPIGYCEEMLASPPEERVRPPWAGALGSKFVVGYAGSMGVSNALDTLLECARRMTDVPHIHFVLIGDGDLRPELESRFGGLCNVSFLPPVPRSDVPAALGACDVLYCSAKASSVWRYGQSLNKLVDYMIAGKPIVLSYSGHPSMVDESGCGTIVPAGNVEALQAELLRMSRLGAGALKEMGDRGRQWILAHRSYRVLAERYHGILAKLCEPMGGKSGSAGTVSRS